MYSGCMMVSQRKLGYSLDIYIYICNGGCMVVVYPVKMVSTTPQTTIPSRAWA